MLSFENGITNYRITFGKFMLFLKNQKNKSIAFRKILTIAFVAIILFFTSNNLQSIAAENNTINAAKIFEVNCAGCHPNGGNIIRRGKNLKQKALQKNKLDSIDSIADLVTHGKNNMSAFGDRLSRDEIQQVSAYVIEEAKKGWR
jgi:cytochrome c6